MVISGEWWEDGNGQYACPLLGKKNKGCLWPEPVDGPGWGELLQPGACPDRAGFRQAWRTGGKRGGICQKGWGAAWGVSRA